MLVLVGFPGAMLWTFFAGYLFDIFGRKLTLFTTFLAGSLFTFSIPYTAPNVVPGLLSVRIMITLCFAAPSSNPLLADYVHREAIGKAAALIGLGYVIGEVLSMGLLFNVTKSLSAYSAFLSVAGTGVFCSTLFLCLVKEPKLRSKDSEMATKAH